MDRFKFRVWDNERNKYHNTGDVIDNNGILGCSAWTVGFVRYKDGLCVIEQCTGLKDKNGKLIYEGDIVKAPHSYKYEIKWSDGNWGLFFGNGLYDICLCERDSKEVEIIGNIHENADLLGEE